MEPPGRAGVGPRIQYAKTADGVSIAYWAIGEGPALVHLPTHAAPTDVEWRIPPMRSFYQQLARNRLLVRYDGRGTGMSDREARDFSLDARMRDLDAVAGRLELQRFALYAVTASGPTAIAYAATRPERISHLIFYSSWAGGPSIREVPALQGLLGLLDSDWTLYTETVAHWVMGWSEGEVARAMAAAVRESTSHEVAKVALRAILEVDVRHLLPLVRAPALVLHVRDGPIPVKITQELVTGMPNARLVVLESSSIAAAPFAAIDEFLGEREGKPSAATDLPQGTAVILFADIADSTALTERLGDAAFREKARALDGALRGVIRENGGTPVEGKLLGDGVLAVFTSARQAIEAALACGWAGDEAGLPLHLGLHAGDVIREEGNVYGGAVNIAARISALSAPSEVLVSGTLRSLARTSAGVSFEDRGERELKGVSEAVRVWAVLRQAQDEREAG